MIEKIIIKQLSDIKKKYGQKRRTELMSAESVKPVEAADMIPDYPVMYYRTREGYIKKVAASSMRGNAEIKSKEGDGIIQTLPGQNTSELLFFTDMCNVYKIHGYDLRDSRPC